MMAVFLGPGALSCGDDGVTVTTGGDATDSDPETAPAETTGAGGGTEGTIAPDCTVDADCDDGLVCQMGVCVPDSSGGCAALVVAPSCGDGVREGAEECDGGRDCDATCMGTEPDAFVRIEPDVWMEAVAVGTAPTSVVGAGESTASAWAVAMDSSGAQQWMATPSGTDVIVRDVTVDERGVIHVVGAQGDQADRQWWVASLGPDGQELWASPPGIEGQAHGVAADGTGNVMVVGSTGGEGTLRVFDGSGIETETLVAAGTTDLRGVVSMGLEDHVAVGFDQGQGTAFVGRWTGGTWAWTVNPPALGPGPDALYDVARTADGIVAGGVADGGPWLLAHGDDGEPQWVESCVGNLLGRIVSVTALDVSSVAVAGEWRPAPADPPRPWLAVVGEGGRVTWSRSVSLTTGTREAAVRTVASDGGRLYGSGWRVLPSDSLEGWVRAYVP